MPGATSCTSTLWRAAWSCNSSPPAFYPSWSRSGRCAMPPSHSSGRWILVDGPAGARWIAVRYWRTVFSRGSVRGKAAIGCRLSRNRTDIVDPARDPLRLLYARCLKSCADAAFGTLSYPALNQGTLFRLPPRELGTGSSGTLPSGHPGNRAPIGLRFRETRRGVDPLWNLAQ